MPNKQVQDQGQELICCSQTITQLITKNFSLANILIFETTATILFAYIIVVEGGFCIYLSFMISGSTLFLSFLWSGRFCGAMLNPIIAILYMIRKQRKMSKLKGILYLICQLVGTIIGSIIGFAVTNNNSPAIMLLEAKLYNTDSGHLFFESFINAFLFCVVFLILISREMTFVELEIQIWFTVPIIYTTVSILGGITTGPNPFFGLFIPIFSCVFISNWTLIHYIWPIVVGPVVGCVLSYFFFQYFYRRFAYAYKLELRDQEEIKREEAQEANQVKNKRQFELV